MVLFRNLLYKIIAGYECIVSIVNEYVTKNMSSVRESFVCAERDLLYFNLIFAAILKLSYGLRLTNAELLGLAMSIFESCRLVS